MYKRQGVSDGQQVDIPVLEYIVMEGRSRLTKACDWLSLIHIYLLGMVGERSMCEEGVP